MLSPYIMVLSDNIISADNMVLHNDQSWWNYVIW
jgi:hypothetical protein